MVSASQSPWDEVEAWLCALLFPSRCGLVGCSGPRTVCAPCRFGPGRPITGWHADFVLQLQRARLPEKRRVRREALEKRAAPHSRCPCPRVTATSPGWARGHVLTTKSSTRLEANPVSPSTKRGCCFTCSQTRTPRDRISNTVVSFSPKEPGGERICCAAARAPPPSRSRGTSLHGLPRPGLVGITRDSLGTADGTVFCEGRAAGGAGPRWGLVGWGWPTGVRGSLPR